jgi:hypothetical protein
MTHFASPPPAASWPVDQTATYFTLYTSASVYMLLKQEAQVVCLLGYGVDNRGVGFSLRTKERDSLLCITF